MYKFLGVLTRGCCLLLCVGVFNTRAGVVQSACAKVFGNKDASVQYREAMQRALRDHGVENPETVGVKQMNKVADRVLGQQLATFSFFGNTWVSEASLDACKPAHKKYTLYHEAAHHAEKHHETMLAGLGALALFTAPSVYCIVQRYTASCNVWVGRSIRAFAALAYLYCFKKYAVEPASRIIEKEADILAAQTLIKTGQADVVAQYVQGLKKQVATAGAEKDPWHKTVEEQIAYLSLLLPRM